MKFISGVKDSIVSCLGQENYALVANDSSVLNCSDDRDLAKKIGELALSEVNLFKNTYNDSMFKYIDRVNFFLGENKTLDLASKYSIMETTKPEVLKLLKEQGYFKEADGYADLGTAAVILPVPENITEFLYATETVFININQDLKSKYNADTFKGIWGDILTNVSNTNNEIDSLFYGSSDKLDRLLILLGYINYIIENGRVEDTVLTSAQLTVIKTLKYNVFVALSNFSTTLDKNSELGLLVSYINQLDNGTTNVYVDKDNYDKFLEEGGSVECLLGFLLSKFSTTSNNNNVYKEILEDAENYKLQYTSMLSTDKIRRAVEVNNKLPNYYSIALSELYRDFSDEAKSIYVPDVNAADKILDEILYDKNDNEQLNVEQVSYELFMKISTMSNYSKFMGYMSNISKSNPELDPKQCATLAFVDLVLSFTLEQLSIVKYNKIQGTIQTGIAL